MTFKDDHIEEKSLESWAIKSHFPDQNHDQDQLDIEAWRQFYELIKLLLEVDLDDNKH
jgi:hypothetical protein